MIKAQIKRDEALDFTKEQKESFDMAHLATISAVQHESKMKLAYLTAIRLLEKTEKELAKDTAIAESKKLELSATAALHKLSQVAISLAGTNGGSAQETLDLARDTALTTLEDARKLAMDMIANARDAAKDVIEDARSTALQHIEREEMLSPIRESLHHIDK